MLRSPEAESHRSSSYPDLTTPDIEDRQVNMRRRNRKQECTCHEDVKNMIKDLMDSSEKRYQDLINTIKIDNLKLIETNETLKNLIENNSKLYVELKNKFDTLTIEQSKSSTRVVELENQLEEVLRYNNKCKLELRNVPKVNDENLADTIVNSLCKTLDLRPDSFKVREIYRRGKDAAPVIIEFSDSTARNNLLQAVKDFNKDNSSAKLNSTHLGIAEEEVPVYVSEVLTAKTRKILKGARDLLKGGKVKYAWARNGTVRIKITQDGPTKIIQSLDELESYKNK